MSLRSPDAFKAIVASYFALLEPFLTRQSDQVVAPREAKELIITALGDAAGGPRSLGSSDA